MNSQLHLIRRKPINTTPRRKKKQQPKNQLLLFDSDVNKTNYFQSDCLQEIALR
jgi:hypothetical protein